MRNFRIPYAKELKTFWIRFFKKRETLQNQLDTIVDKDLMDECLADVQMALEREINKRKVLDTRRELVENKGKWVDSIYLKLQEGKKLSRQEQKKLEKYQITR